MTFACYFGSKNPVFKERFEKHAANNCLKLFENNEEELLIGAQSYYCSDGLIFIFNGLLINRKELLKTNRLNGNTNEAEIIKHLYLADGLNFIKNLDGFFSIIIFDTKNKKLYAISDHIGSEPIFFRETGKGLIISSQIDFLLNFGDMEIDQTRILSFFQCIHPLKNETFYKQISELQASQILSYSQNKLKISNYIPFDSNKYADVNGFDEFRILHKNVFEESVRGCIGNEVKIGTALSGGLDSSTITAISNNIPEVETRSFTAVFNDLKGEDKNKSYESNFSNALTKQYKNKCFQINFTDNGPRSYLKRNIHNWSEPDLLLNGYIHEGIFKNLKEKKLKVFLDGYGGDSVVSHGYNYLNELGSGFKIKSLLEEAEKLYKKNGRQLPIFEVIKRYVIANIIPEYLHWLHKSNSKQQIQQIKMMKRLDKSYHPKNLYKFYKEIYGFYPFRYTESAKYIHSKDISNPIISISVKAVKKLANNYGVDIRFPFLSKRYMELSMCTPVEFKLKNGVNRYIFREAFKDILPTSIYERVSKSDLSPLCNAQMKSLTYKELSVLSNKVTDGIFNQNYLKQMMGDVEQNVFEIYQVYTFLKWADKLNLSPIKIDINHKNKYGLIHE